jgi:hypothetical protein
MLLYTRKMKIVGKRRTVEDLTPISPQEALARASILQEQLDLLNPYPRPRGFVFKARTWEEYERWRKNLSPTRGSGELCPPGRRYFESVNS